MVILKLRRSRRDSHVNAIVNILVVFAYRMSNLEKNRSWVILKDKSIKIY